MLPIVEPLIRFSSCHSALLHILTIKGGRKTANVTKPIFAFFQRDWRENVNVRVVALEEIILFHIRNIYWFLRVPEIFEVLQRNSEHWLVDRRTTCLETPNDGQLASEYQFLSRRQKNQWAKHRIWSHTGRAFTRRYRLASSWQRRDTVLSIPIPYGLQNQRHRIIPPGQN